MESKNINAFTGKEESAFGQDTGHYYGMTLRDYFAAKAMQSVLSNQTFLETVLRDAQVGTIASDAVSRTAFVMADAMLKQREK